MKSFATCTTCGRIIWRHQKVCTCGQPHDPEEQERGTAASIRAGCGVLAVIFSLAAVATGIAFYHAPSRWYLLFLSVVCGLTALDYWHSTITGEKPHALAVLIDILFISRIHP